MMKMNLRVRETAKRATMRVYCVLLVCLFPAMADAVEPKSPEQKVVSCIPCHGANGISVHDTWPSLAGQDIQYLATQLKAFRDGKRKSEMMYPMAFDLTDKDIDDIANYFHQLKCK